MAILKNIMSYQFKRERVSAEELQPGGEIIVKEMDARQALKFNEKMIELNKDDSIKGDAFVYWMAAMCAACMVDEEDNYLFNPDFYRELPKHLPYKLMERIYDKAAEMNGFTPVLRDKSKKPLAQARKES